MAFCVPVPHIYPSVGYCVVYLSSGLSTTFKKINGSQLHTFFVYTSNILSGLRDGLFVMCKKELDLVCLPLVTQSAPDVLVVPHDLEQYKEAVVVYKDTYAELFAPKSANQAAYWKPQIVKISFGDRCIYRKAHIATIKGLDSKTIGLTYNSIGELTNYSKKGANISPNNDVVTISKGCRWAYWRRHPNPAARISFLLGSWSIVLGLISILTSILLNIIDK